MLRSLWVDKDSTPEVAASARGALPSYRLFWVLGFTYAALMALMFQKLILPLMPPLHAGHGLLFNDAMLFHEMAVDAAARIHAEGWSAWQLFPSNGAGGNVGLLSALYALFGPDPAWFIPFNAAAHATGALMLYRIGPRLWPGRTGSLGGFVAGLLFLVFPSALQWYGQNLKDGFSIAGILMVLCAQLECFAETHQPAAWRNGILTSVIGTALVALVRPYFPALIFGGLVLAWLGPALWALRPGRRVKEGPSVLRSFCLLAVVGVVTLISLQSRIGTTILDGGISGGDKGVYVRLTDWEWTPSSWAPTFLDRGFKKISETRAHFVGYNLTVSAGSGIDGDRLPGTIIQSLEYFPRALAVGLFSPFPSAWHQNVSGPRLVGAIETAVWYLFFPGVLLLLKRRPSRPLMFGLCFVTAFVTLLAYVYPNVGNLYRQRFAFWMFVLAVGAVGWAGVLGPLLARMVPAAGLPDCMAVDAVEERSEPPRASGVHAVVAAGALVMAVTLVCYLGFIARDLLLVRNFGMNANLDAYFFAAMLPMFFVTCLAMPVADTLMRPFVDLHAMEGLERAGALARVVLWHGFLGMGGLSVVLAVAAVPLMRLGLHQADAALVDEAATMFRCFVPLLVLSAWTVVGNAILNGLRHYRAAALAQLVVPVVTITAILAAPSEYGVYPAIFGMVVGTAINAVLIAWTLRRVGVTLWPKPMGLRGLPPTFIKTYRQLALAGLVAAATTPLGYTLAGMAGVGGISIWALATKMITLFSGLASVGVAAVALPAFARLMRERFSMLRQNALLLLVGGNLLGGVVAALICLFSLPITVAVFGHEALGEARARTFGYVLCIGAMQIPIVITWTTMMKMSAVIGTSARALAGSAIAFVVNLVLALILIKPLGVMGLAGAALVSSAFSAFYLAVMVRRACGFGLSEAMVLVLGWVVWGGVSLAATTSNLATIFCALIGVWALAWVQIRMLSPGGITETV